VDAVGHVDTVGGSDTTGEAEAPGTAGFLETPATDSAPPPPERPVMPPPIEWTGDWGAELDLDLEERKLVRDERGVRIAREPDD
jgi:hypothetical protein